MREHPHWAAVTVRTARVLVYAMAVTAGVSAFLFSPRTLSVPGAIIIVSSMAIFGLACLVGTILQNYIIEWISLFFLTAGMSCYVITVWFSVWHSPARLAGTAVLSMLVLLLVIRVVDLTVYWWKNVRIARLVKDMEDDT